MDGWSAEWYAVKSASFDDKSLQDLHSSTFNNQAFTDTFIHKVSYIEATNTKRKASGHKLTFLSRFVTLDRDIGSAFIRPSVRLSVCHTLVMTQN